MSVHVGTGTFTTKSGTGTQVVTGVTDQSGAAFTPVVIMFWGGFGLVGTFTPFSAWQVGFDDLTTHTGMTMSRRPKAQAGVAYVSSLYNAATYSINNSDAGFPPPNVIRAAYVSAVASGQFTVTYDVNFESGDPIHYFAFAGSTLEYSISNIPATDGTGSVTGLAFAPTAAIIFWHNIANSPASLPYQTGFQASLGWAVQSGAQRCFAAWDASPALSVSTCARYQVATLAGARFQLDGSVSGLGTITATLDVTGWTSDGITFTATDPNPGTAMGWRVLFLGGDLFAEATTLLSPLATGVQTLPLSTVANPIGVLFGSVNAVASSSVQTEQRVSVGSAVKLAQGSYWTGDDTGIDPDDPSECNWTDACLTLAHPTSPGASPSGSIDAQAAISAFNPSSVAIDWTTADVAVRREAIALIFGTTAPTPTPTGTARMRRIVRRFPLPYETNLYQFLSRLEIIIQSGVGLTTGQGSDPVIMCRISRDGGSTFGNQLTMGMGAVGQYDFRAYLTNLGRGRNFVVELVITDPVYVALLGAVAELTTGTS